MGDRELMEEVFGEELEDALFDERVRASAEEARKASTDSSVKRSRDDSGRFSTEKSPSDLLVELEELKAAIPSVDAKYGRDSEHAARIRQAYEAKFRQHYETRSKAPAQTVSDYERFEMDARPAFLADARSKAEHEVDEGDASERADLQAAINDVRQSGWTTSAAAAAIDTRARLVQSYERLVKEQGDSREARIQALVDKRVARTNAGFGRKPLGEEIPSKPLTIAEAREQMSEEQLLKIADYAEKRGGQI